MTAYYQYFGWDLVVQNLKKLEAHWRTQGFPVSRQENFPEEAEKALRDIKNVVACLLRRQRSLLANAVPGSPQLRPHFLLEKVNDKTSVFRKDITVTATLGDYLICLLGSLLEDQDFV